MADQQESNRSGHRDGSAVRSGGTTPPESRHISVWVNRPFGEVYDYAADPANVPQWAPGLATSVEQIGGQWVAESPMGRIVVVFTPRNDYGVLDHNVTLPSGETVYNPMRVLAGESGCEVVFTVRRRPEMSDEDFARDVNAVSADLTRLKRVLEGRTGSQV